MNRYHYFSIIAIFIPGCGSISKISNQQGTPTSIIEISTNTPGIQTDFPPDEIDNYTQELHSRVRNCVEFRDVYDFTIDGEFLDHNLGTRKVKECIDFLLELEPPDDCRGCELLTSLVEGFSNQTLASMELIEQGYETNKSVFISEGLVTFWDADLIWEAIRFTIDRTRTEYNLPEIN